MDDSPWVELVRWDGPVSPDDPDANFKADVAVFGLLDPLSTVTELARHLDIPVGALVRYVLARWASAGSEGLLAAGPSVVERMWDACRRAEDEATDEARLAAYAVLRDMVAWLRLPLSEDPA